jgi:hypothetical protein
MHIFKVRKKLLVTASLVGIIAAQTASLSYANYSDAMPPKQVVEVRSNEMDEPEIQGHRGMMEQMRLHQLFQDHAVLAAEVNMYRYDNNRNFLAAQQQADENAEMIAEEVGMRYGPEKEQVFLDLWKQHLKLFVLYTDSLKTNNPEQKEQALSEMDTFIQRTSTLLAEDDSSLEDLRMLLSEHVEIERGITDAHATQDYAARDQLLRTGQDHATMMADYFMNDN